MLVHSFEVCCVSSSLQTQMNLQLCFINNSESEEEEDEEEKKKGEIGKKESGNTRVSTPKTSRVQSKRKLRQVWEISTVLHPMSCYYNIQYILSMLFHTVLRHCWWREGLFRSIRILSLLPSRRNQNPEASGTLWGTYETDWEQTTKLWWGSTM